MQPRSVKPTRQQLIGAWRLSAVEFRAASGETHDPFYQEGSSGIIVYDASGWMSVQITAPNRRRFEIPTTRIPGASGGDLPAKAEAFDTYYAYYGTWSYDAAKASVTHHVESSLIAAENGSEYAQAVSLEDGRLVFTGLSGAPGQQQVRRKVWERLSSASVVRGSE